MQIALPDSAVASNMYVSVAFPMEVSDMTTYGNKSEPPLKAIKEMKSKQSQESSKDPLHKGIRPRKEKGKQNKKASTRE